MVSLSTWHNVTLIVIIINVIVTVLFSYFQYNRNNIYIFSSSPVSTLFVYLQSYTTNSKLEEKKEKIISTHNEFLLIPNNNQTETKIVFLNSLIYYALKKTRNLYYKNESILEKIAISSLVDEPDVCFGISQDIYNIKMKTEIANFEIEKMYKKNKSNDQNNNDKNENTYRTIDITNNINKKFDTSLYYRNKEKYYQKRKQIKPELLCK